MHKDNGEFEKNKQRNLRQTDDSEINTRRLDDPTKTKLLGHQLVTILYSIKGIHSSRERVARLGSRRLFWQSHRNHSQAYPVVIIT